MKKFINKFIQVSDEPDEQPVEIQQNAQQLASVAPAQVPNQTSNKLSQTVSQQPMTQQPVVNANPFIQNTATVQPASPTPNMETVKSLYQDLIDADGLPREYLDFKNNADALINMGMSDKQRFEAALRILQVRDKTIDKNRLINGVVSYIKKLQEIKDNALNECETKRAQINSYGESQIASNQMTIDNKRELISKLQSEIASYDEEINHLLLQNNDVTVKKQEQLTELDQTLATFQASVQYVETALNSDKELINSLF